MEQFLDIRTLSFMTGFISILLSITMIVIYINSKTYEGFLPWVIAFSLNAISMILISLRTLVPDFISIIIANLIITLFLMFLDYGLTLFFHKKENGWVTTYIPLLLIQTMWFIYFTYIDNNIPMRIIFINAMFIGLLAHSAYTIHKYSAKILQHKQWFLISTLLTLSVWYVIRLIFTLMSDNEIVHFMHAGTIHGLSFTMLIAGNIMITLGLLIIQNRRVTIELQKSNKEVNNLEQFIPICANCKKIRDDKGYWDQVERYISSRTSSQFSHSICPECAEKLYGKEIRDINLYKDK